MKKIINLLRPYQHWFDHAKSNIVTIAIFTIAAMIIGQGVPDLYFKYFDKTVYYSIKNPVPVEGIVHRPGEEVIIEISRDSLVTTDAVSVSELVLYSENMEVEHYRRDLAITVGKENIHAVFTLPVTLREGTYYYRGVVSYKVRGIQKSAPFYTDKFEVTK